MTTTVQSNLGISSAINRDTKEKVFDIISSKDFGGKSDGVTDDTSVINSAITSIAANIGSGILVLPHKTIYTEASIVMQSNVIILDLSVSGKLLILTKDEGSGFPVTKGGLEVRTQNQSGIFIRTHDLGTPTNPLMEFINSSTGQLAGIYSLLLKLSSYIDVTEMATPPAPAANIARLFVKDNGAGKTQLCVRFNTGAVQIISTEP